MATTAEVLQKADRRVREAQQELEELNEGMDNAEVKAAIYHLTNAADKLAALVGIAEAAENDAILVRGIAEGS